jgi:hypothetical protein
MFYREFDHQIFQLLLALFMNDVMFITDYHHGNREAGWVGGEGEI